MGKEYVSVDGLSELIKTLDDIAPKEARNLARVVVHAIAGNVAKDMRARAPRNTGRLKRAIHYKRKNSKNPNKIYSDVLIKQGKGAEPDAYYWRFVEYGVKGGALGPQPPKPFARPAIEAARANMPSMMREEFGKKYAKLLQRKAKRAAK